MGDRTDVADWRRFLLEAKIDLRNSLLFVKYPLLDALFFDQAKILEYMGRDIVDIRDPFLGESH